MIPLVALLSLESPAQFSAKSPDGPVVWSARSGAPAGAGFVATTGAWTPDGRHVLAAGCSWTTPGGPLAGEVRVWDAATGKHLRSFRGGATSYASRAGHLAVGPDGQTVAAGGWKRDPNGLPGDFAVEVWDWGAATPRLKLGGFRKHVSGVAFSPDGRRLTAVDGAGVLIGWDAATGKQILRTTVEAGWGFGLSHHPRQPVLVGADREGNVRLLDAGTGAPVSTVLKGQSADGFLSAVFSPDGRAVACAETNTGQPPLVVVPVHVGDVGPISVGKAVAASGAVDGCVYQAAYSPDGTLVAAACQDKTVRLYSARTAVQLAVAAEHTGFVYSVAFSPDGRRLLSVGRDAVKVWSVAALRAPRPTP